MILIDFTQIVIGAACALQSELKGASRSGYEDIVRHVALSSVLNLKRQFGKKYGAPVLCTDGRHYWRTAYFPFYKWSRHHARDTGADSSIDWTLMFEVVNQLRQEFSEVLPYRVINVTGAEADDVIAVLTQHSSKELRDVPGKLMAEPEPILIASSDKDFKQLQLLGDHIRQWSPVMKKFITGSHREIEAWRIEHIVKGDSGDGVPNIFSPDDVFTRASEGARQTRVSSKRLQEFIEHGASALKTEDERRGWDRNQTLVDLAFIPEKVRADVLEAYENSAPKGGINTVRAYLIEHKCRLLMRDLQDF